MWDPFSPSYHAFHQKLEIQEKIVVESSSCCSFSILCLIKYWWNQWTDKIILLQDRFCNLLDCFRDRRNRHHHIDTLISCSLRHICHFPQDQHIELDIRDQKWPARTDNHPAYHWKDKFCSHWIRQNNLLGRLDW